jgi:small subunit ribosomal protein S21
VDLVHAGTDARAGAADPVRFFAKRPITLGEHRWAIVGDYTDDKRIGVINKWGISDTGGEFTVSNVVLRSGESQDNLVRRFRKKVMRDGILREVKRKRHFVSKSEKRRIAKRKAIRRIRRRQLRNQ